MSKVNKARIILRIWLKSFYQVTVNYLTTSESVPRVPHGQRCPCKSLTVWLWLRPSGTGVGSNATPLGQKPGRGGFALFFINAKFPCPGIIFWRWLEKITVLDAATRFLNVIRMI